jgi:hypothetical protein
MAAIPVTFQGILFFSDLGVGGGPMPGGPGGPGIWPSPGVPTHPIAGPPPGIWPSPGHPDQGLPQPPQIWPAPGVPTHPIAGQPPYPSQGGPFPTHPIVLPPYQPGGPPVTIWPNPGRPSNPIVLPPPPQVPDGEGAKPPPADEPGWGYSPQYGWAFFPSGGSPSPKK